MRSGLRTATVALAIVAGWLLAGPQQLGGPAAAVSTFGDSMLPTYQPHHLVVVRRTPTYEVGDIVAYHSETLNTVVLHRIVGRDANGFITQGDNNDWLDPDRPDTDDMIGRAWLAIPQLGRLFELPAPARAAIPLLALTGVMMLTRSSPSGHRRRWTRREPGRTTRQDGGGRRLTGPLTQLIAALGLLTVAVGLTAVVWNRPTTTAGPVDFEQRATFGYGAEVDAATVYPDGRVDTGEPIFLQVTDKIEVTLNWRWDSDVPSTLAGTGQLTAHLTDSSGWQASVPLGPPVDWSGTTATVTGTLDFARLQRLAGRAARATGIAAEQLTVAISADLDVRGQLTGVPVSTNFAPTLVFRVVPLRATVTASATDAGTGTTADTTFTDVGSVTVPGAATAQLVVAGRAMSVPHARWISLLLTAGALGFTAIAAVGARGARGWDEHDHIMVQHGDQIIEVAGLSPVAHDTTAAVKDVNQLVILAGHRDLPVLRVPLRAGGYAYVVDDLAIRYYSIPAPTGDETRAQESSGSHMPSSADRPAVNGAFDQYEERVTADLLDVNAGPAPSS